MSRIHVDITAAGAENARLPAIINRAANTNTALRRLKSAVDPRILGRNNLQARLSATCNEAATIERQLQSLHVGISQFLSQYSNTERRLRSDAVSGNLNNKRGHESSANSDLFSDAERRRGLSAASAKAIAVGVGASAMTDKISTPITSGQVKRGATGAVVSARDNRRDNRIERRENRAMRSAARREERRDNRFQRRETRKNNRAMRREARHEASFGQNLRNASNTIFGAVGFIGAAGLTFATSGLAAPLTLPLMYFSGLRTLDGATGLTTGTEQNTTKEILQHISDGNVGYATYRIVSCVGGGTGKDLLKCGLDILVNDVILRDHTAQAKATGAKRAKPVQVGSFLAQAAQA